MNKNSHGIIIAKLPACEVTAKSFHVSHCTIHNNALRASECSIKLVSEYSTVK